MDTIPTTREIRKINLMTRITLIFFGIFITSSIFAITVKIFETIGIWIGLVISLGLSFCGFYFKESGSRTRIVTWSILAAIIIIGVVYFAGLNYLFKTLEGFRAK